jgi:hypothetical protein
MQLADMEINKQELEAHNKQELLAQLEQTRAALQQTLEGFDAKEMNTVPPYGGWTTFGNWKRSTLP